MGLPQAKLLAELAETDPMLPLEENCKPYSKHIGAYLYLTATGCLNGHITISSH